MRAKRYASRGVEGDAKGIIRSVEQTTDRAAGTITAPALAIPRAHDGVLVDLWIARVLVAAALGLVLLVGIRVALDQPVYGPIDEAYHAGYVEKIAATGFPPMLGRDPSSSGIARCSSRAKSATRATEGQCAASRSGFYSEEQQQEAIQPPLYYYILAPITWFTRGSDKIYALRIASSVLNALGVLFLFLALRGTFRREPLAAGVAAVVIASFTGITHLLSQVQNDALLLPVCVLLCGRSCTTSGNAV